MYEPFTSQRPLIPWIAFVVLAVLLMNCISTEVQMADSNNPLPECPNSPNCVRTQITVALDSAKTLAIITTTLTEMKAHSIEISEDSTQINSVFRIPVFGWLDDMDIVLNENDGSTTVYIRSASRIGYSDLGVNKRRVRKFIRILTRKTSA